MSTPNRAEPDAAFSSELMMKVAAARQLGMTRTSLNRYIAKGRLATVTMDGRDWVPVRPAAVNPFAIAVVAAGADEVRAALTVGASEAAVRAADAAFIALVTVDAVRPALNIWVATRTVGPMASSIAAVHERGGGGGPHRANRLVDLLAGVLVLNAPHDEVLTVVEHEVVLVLPDALPGPSNAFQTPVQAIGVIDETDLAALGKGGQRDLLDHPGVEDPVLPRILDDRVPPRGEPVMLVAEALHPQVVPGANLAFVVAHAGLLACSWSCCRSLLYGSGPLNFTAARRRAVRWARPGLADRTGRWGERRGEAGTRGKRGSHRQHRHPWARGPGSRRC